MDIFKNEFHTRNVTTSKYNRGNSFKKKYLLKLIFRLMILFFCVWGARLRMIAVWSNDGTFNVLDDVPLTDTMEDDEQEDEGDESVEEE